jgi:hypothetical protein
MNLGERRFRIMSKQLAHYQYAWLTTLSMTLLLALVLNVTVVSAGSFLLKDSAGLLTASDKSCLQSSANSLPFSVQVLTTKNYSNQSSFDSYVNAQLQGPTYIIIGVSDGFYKGTRVEIGTGTGINANNASIIVSAGDSFFRANNWQGGVAAIMQSAAGFSSLRSANSNSSSNCVPVKESNITNSVVLLFISIFAFIVVLGPIGRIALLFIEH